MARANAILRADLGRDAGRLLQAERQILVGTHGPTTFHCSGLIYWAYQQAEVSIPTNTEGQRTPPKVPVNDLWPGDLMHYAGSGPSGRHVVMFIGRDAAGVAWSIEAKGAAYGVVLSSNHSPSGAVMITRAVP